MGGEKEQVEVHAFVKKAMATVNIDAAAWYSNMSSPDAATATLDRKKVFSNDPAIESKLKEVKKKVSLVVVVLFVEIPI
jgi:hypothetical protein